MTEPASHPLAYLRRTDEKLDRIEGRLEVVDSRFDRIEGRLERVEDRLARIEDELLVLNGIALRLEGREMETTGLKAMLDRHERWLGKLGRRVGELEGAGKSERRPGRARPTHALAGSATLGTLFWRRRSWCGQMLEYASDEIHLVSKEDFKRLLGYEEPFLEEWLLSKCGSLDKKERSDYADVSTGRILRRNEEFVPNHLSREYVAYLEGKEKRATVCKEKQLLEHQRSVLARAQVQ